MNIHLTIDAPKGWKRRALLHVALPIALVAATAAVAGAYDTSWIAPGQPVASSKLKANLDEAQARLAALEAAPPDMGPRSQVSLMFGAGRGSQRPNVHRWSHVVTNIGSDITYIDSPTNGAELLINTDGVYAISWGVRVATGALDLAISRNQVTDFNVSVNSIANPELYFLATGTTPAGALTSRVDVTVVLQQNDIIRAISVGSDDPTNFHNTFSITKVAN